MGSRSIICQSLKAEANNIDLPDRCRSDLPFSHKSDHKKERRVVSFMHEQNIICNQTQLDDIAHEQTITVFIGSYLQVMW